MDSFTRLLGQTIVIKTAATVTHATSLGEAGRTPAGIFKIVDFVGAHERIVVSDKSVKILLTFFFLCSWLLIPASILLFIVLTEATIVVPIVLRQEL